MALDGLHKKAVIKIGEFDPTFTSKTQRESHEVLLSMSRESILKRFSSMVMMKENEDVHLYLRRFFMFDYTCFDKNMVEMELYTRLNNYYQQLIDSFGFSQHSLQEMVSTMIDDSECLLSSYDLIRKYQQFVPEVGMSLSKIKLALLSLLNQMELKNVNGELSNDSLWAMLKVMFPAYIRGY